jgi:hypothetical protein
LVPLIVTTVPTGAEAGVRLLIAGVCVSTVNDTPLLAVPLTVTTTLPLAAPAGTGTTMLVALQLVGVAAIPLNFTVLLPCAPPKLVPVIVTAVPTLPEVGLKLEMPGAVA